MCSGGECVVAKEEAVKHGCIVKTKDHFTSASGSQPIWLNEIKCDGHEWSLTDCHRTNWGETHICGHKEDAGCRCQPRGAATVPTPRVNSSTLAMTSVILTVPNNSG